MKPHIICHMASSIDGRILPERWTPSGAHSHDIYEDLHDRLGGGSWLVGRVTGQEFAKRDAYPDQPEASFLRTAWLPNHAAEAYGIVLDAHGKIAWGRSDVSGDPIVVVLTKAVSDAHLAGLREDGVGYVFAGETDLDPRLSPCRPHRRDQPDARACDRRGIGRSGRFRRLRHGGFGTVADRYSGVDES
jgi:riboflavin biosynthesis pyrimidine reductase